MLTIYRRHRSTCRHKDDRISKKCRCGLWATGTLERKPYRKSLKTRSFGRAQQLIKKIEDGRVQENRQPVSTEAALGAFVRDCEARNLSRGTLRNYRLLQTRLAEFTGRPRKSSNASARSSSSASKTSGSLRIPPKVSSRRSPLGTALKVFHQTSLRDD